MSNVVKEFLSNSYFMTIGGKTIDPGHWSSVTITNTGNKKEYENNADTEYSSLPKNLYQTTITIEGVIAHESNDVYERLHMYELYGLVSNTYIILQPRFTNSTIGLDANSNEGVTYKFKIGTVQRFQYTGNFYDSKADTTMARGNYEIEGKEIPNPK